MRIFIVTLHMQNTFARDGNCKEKDFQSLVSKVTKIVMTLYFLSDNEKKRNNKTNHFSKCVTVTNYFVYG